MLSRSSLEVRAVVVVLSEKGEGKGGGASEVGGSLVRVWWWREDVAEAEAE